MIINIIIWFWRFKLVRSPLQKGAMDFKYGIEHEVAFLRADGAFADFANTPYAEFDAIVERLPWYEQDYPQLRVGDAGIKLKRWYIEGFERFSQDGEVIDCPPKGIEIRTTVKGSIEGAIAQLSESFGQLCEQASKDGFSPALISFHPYRNEFVASPPLNEFERSRRQESPEMQTAHIPMLTQGPDLNLSAQGLTPAELIDIGQKLTFYSPFIVPFSFSSPFYLGKPWLGLSARTYYRTGVRPAAMVFVANELNSIDSTPSLTQIARVPAEVGRIEFKAFDSCGDFELYGCLLSLLKGLILDKTLSGRALVPDAKLHQQSAQSGFDNELIYSEAQKVLEAAFAVTEDSLDTNRLERLQSMLHSRYSPAKDMLDDYRRGCSIVEVLSRGYRASSTQAVVA